MQDVDGLPHTKLSINSAETMFCVKRDKTTPLMLHKTNIELDIGRGSEDDSQNGILSNVKNKDKNESNAVRRNYDRYREHWPRISGNPRPGSAPADKTKPRYLRFMSKSGQISTDVRKHVRPSTAQPYLHRAKGDRSDVCRRNAYSAGRMRGRNRNNIIVEQDEINIRKHRTTNAEEIRKEAWPSRELLEKNRSDNTANRSDITFDSNRANVSTTEIAIRRPNMVQTAIKTNKTKDEKVVTFDETLQIRAITESEQGYMTEDQPKNINCRKAVPPTGTAPVSFKSTGTNDCWEKLNTKDLRRKKDELKTVIFAGSSYQTDAAIAGDHDDKRYSRKPVVGLFRKSAIFVCSILRLQVYMTDLSAEVTSRSATEEQWHTVNTSRQVKELVFNKDLYAKSKAVSRIPFWARAILDKSPDDRTDRDLRRIHALLRGLKSFDKFTEKIQLAMCRSFTYQWATSARIILRQGHVGQNFYFIYTGSVFVNIDDIDKHGNKFVKTEVVLKRGESFGELALLQDIRRTATISCREDCEMLVVDKDTFAQVCPRIFEEELEEKCDFLGDLSMFSPKYWTRESLKKMCFEARIQEHKTNKVIVSDSSMDEWIYICMEGKASVIRKLDLKKEIEWRRRRRRMISEIKSNQPSTGDVIDMLGVVEARAYSAEVRHERISEQSNSKVGKERLLTSMGLEYTKTERLSADEIGEFLGSKRPSKANSKPTINGTQTPEDEPPTLTAMLAGEKETDMLFLNIKTLQQNEIFDINSMFVENSFVEERGYILASEGCKVLRIQKQSFLEEASDKAILHAKALAEIERYPDDEQLLRNYMDHLTWITYKYSLLDNILRPKGSRKKRDSEALRISAKKNEKDLEILTTLNQAFYEYDPEMRRVAQWKQMQEMAAQTPKEREFEYTEVLTDIRKHGTLIPELHVDIRDNGFKPKEIAAAKELVSKFTLLLSDKKNDPIFESSTDETDVYSSVPR